MEADLTDTLDLSLINLRRTPATRTYHFWTSGGRSWLWEALLSKWKPITHGVKGSALKRLLPAVGAPWCCLPSKGAAVTPSKTKGWLFCVFLLHQPQLH